MLRFGRVEEHCNDSRGMIVQRATYCAYFQISSTLLYANCAFLRGRCWIIHWNSNEPRKQDTCGILSERRERSVSAARFVITFRSFDRRYFCRLACRRILRVSYCLSESQPLTAPPTFESTVLAPLSPPAGLFFLLTTPVFAFYRFALGLIGVMDFERYENPGKPANDAANIESIN